MQGEHLFWLSHAATGAPADQIMRLVAAPAAPASAAGSDRAAHPAEARRAARRRWGQAAEGLYKRVCAEAQPITSRIMATKGASAGGIA